MGLLDAAMGVFDPKTAQQAGLLNTAMYLLGNKDKRFGQAIGNAGLLGMQATQQFQDRQAQQQHRDLQTGLLRGQMEDAQQARTARQNLVGKLGMPGYTLTAADVYGVSPEMGLQMAMPKGPAKIKQYVEGRNPDGSVKMIGLDEYGNPVDTGVSPFMKPTYQDTGASIVAIDPITNKPVTVASKSASPESVLSAATQRRGQDLVDARSRESLALDREKVARTVDAPTAKMADAKDTLAIILDAEPLIDVATGSLAGANFDKAAGALGYSLPGAQAAAQLKVLEGQLIAKMPKMSGPQSDRDALLYKQMAAQIGDPEVPAATKKAALAMLKTITQRNAGVAPSPEQAPAGQPSVSNW